jgi:transcription termination factor Rho
MSVLDRSALEASPLADLHATASELSIDGYRRLRRAALIDAILDKQEGAERPAPSDDELLAEEEEEDRATTRRRRGRRGGRGRSSASAEEDESAAEEEQPEARPAEPAKDDDEREDDDRGSDEDELVAGVVELLPNGSGFVRVQPPNPSDDDVYISAAQVKRCELVSGDQITGPKRAPRRSERFASLIRIETINDRPASELADSVRFDDLPAQFPDAQLTIGSGDATLEAIDWLTPFGKGSRVTIVGAARSGKSHTLRQLADALVEHDGLSVQVVLAGVRPEEIAEWGKAKVAPAAALSFAASEDAQNGVIEPVIDQARRLAARGSDAVVLIDSLDGCSPQMARRALASARDITDGGSLTVIATASAPIGGETTVIALDHELTSVGRFPAIDIFASGTMRPELLVGNEGAEAIARIRIEASEIAAE